MNDPLSLEESMRRELAENLCDLTIYRMPYGRYQNRLLHTLPFEYLHWFVERAGGFPKGRLGELMDFVYQTKSVGAELVFASLPRK